MIFFNPFRLLRILAKLASKFRLDINRHAIHLAASMLTLSAQKIDYNRMNLYNMQHGVNAEGEVRVGSVDILVDDAWFLPADAFAPSGEQLRRKERHPWEISWKN